MNEAAWEKYVLKFKRLIEKSNVEVNTECAL